MGQLYTHLDNVEQRSEGFMKRQWEICHHNVGRCAGQSVTWCGKWVQHRCCLISFANLQLSPRTDYHSRCGGIVHVIRL